MSGFSAAWLALREPADARARDAGLLRRLADWTRRSTTVRLVDLGCGTGSTVRAVAPALPVSQSWTCIDHDAALLALARDAAGPTWTVAVRQVDLARDVESVLDGRIDVLTASALLDLVSASWLGRIVHPQVAQYYALNFNGRIVCDPPHREDAAVTAAFDAHQRRDKGFGPALGPDAAVACERVLRDAGLAVSGASSDWVLDAASPADAALIAPLLDGIAAAAIEQVPARQASFLAWRDARRASLAAERLHVVIGHRDVLALPRGQ